MESKKPTQKISFQMLVIAGIFFVGGAFFGNSYKSSLHGFYDKTTPKEGVNFDTFWSVWNSIDEKYIGAKDVSDEDRMYGAIQGLVQSLGDPYSEFFPPEESKEFQEVIEGEFSGLGMEVGKRDGLLTVITPLKDSPAEKAGIKAGDVVLKIDGENLKIDASIDEAISKMRGPKGTSVTLTIFREEGEETLEITVVRDIIIMPTVEGSLRPDGIYVINLYNFNAQSKKMFDREIESFLKTGSKKLILDLRGNPGGYLDIAIDIAGWFIPEGSVVVSEDFGDNTEDIIYRSKKITQIPKDVKIAVLVDQGSASASEILAGALKEYGRAKIIGEQTFGKGSVQELVPITSDTSFKITIAKWLTPNGTSISEKGLPPDILVEYDSEAKEDNQIERAVLFLNTDK